MKNTNNKAHDAVRCHKKGFNCAQAVFSAYAKELGVDEVTAFKVSSAFGAGMSRMGETCGAVTGALMAIGFKYGQIDADDKLAKEKTYELGKKFMKIFKSRNSFLLCKELLGHDISTPEGLKAICEGDFSAICNKLIQDSVEILDGILR
jgi:C_GCAxxG_C_C family probable redox protein